MAPVEGRNVRSMFLTNCLAVIFGLKVRLQFEKRQGWMPTVKGERLQGIAKGRSSAPHLDNSSAGLLFRKNKCAGTH